MAAIKPLVPKKDYNGIASQIRSMKRLWIGQGLDGLLKRRDEEAKMVQS
jgi:GH24 family phage-related lysozyme (muramidase)